MCSKKSYLLTFFLLIAVLTVSATADERWWSGLGEGSLWDTALNWWEEKAPTDRSDCFVDMVYEHVAIDSSVTATAESVHVGEWNSECYLDMTGGTLTVDSTMYIGNLAHEWGYAAGQVTLSAGTMNIGGDMYCCNNGWWGLFKILGGTCNVTGTVWVPGGADSDSVSAVSGELYVYGGTLNCGDFDSNDLGYSRNVDFVAGKLIIDGDDTADINEGVTDGWIVAYGGETGVVFDYDVTTAGKTTVTADGSQFTDEGANHLWSNSDNWIGGVPTSSDFTGIALSGTECLIDNTVTANTDKLVVGYLATGSVNLTLTGGSLTTAGDFIVGATGLCQGIVSASGGDVNVNGSLSIAAESQMDVNGSTITLLGDQRDNIWDFIDLGVLIAKGGGGRVKYDYNVTNSGQTTIVGLTSTDHTWNNDAAGDSDWSNADNWVEDDVPNDVDTVFINVASSNSVIGTGTTAVCDGLQVGKDTATCYLDITGGTLNVSPYTYPRNFVIGNLPGGTGQVSLSSGTVTAEGNLLVGNSGTGTLNVSGGTLTVDKALIVPAATGTGTVNLSGGIINVGADIANAGLEMKSGGTGLVDVKGGTLVVSGDLTARVKEYSAQGGLVAYGGRGKIVYDYNVTNSGKTTITGSSNNDVAYSPSPAAGAENVSADANLTWTAGAGATSHNVYLGASFDDVNDATTGSDEYKGNYGTASYNPDLDEGTTYYWRIDEVAGSTTKGNVWAFTVAYPSDVRNIINFNADWKYYRGAISGDAASASNYDDYTWRDVHVPFNWRNLAPGTGWPVPAAEDISWYRKQFTIPTSYSGKKVFVDFEAVDNQSWVWINGTAVSNHHGTIHKGAFLPFTVDITDYVNFGSTVNVLAVKADNAWDDDIPEYSRWLNYGGISRNVDLRIVDNLYITDAVDANVVAGGGVFVSFSNISSSSATATVKTHVQNDSGSSKTCSVKAIILDANDDIVASDTSSSQAISDSSSYQFSQNLTVTDPCMWGPNTPYRYTVVTEVYDGTTHVDSYSTPVGIKTIAFDGTTGFSINGDRIIWLGANRTQDFVWLANNMTDFQHKLDAQRLRDCGFQHVRSSSYPQSPAYLDGCDELGVMVQNEIAGFHYYVDGGEFEQQSYQDMRDLVRRDRNRPSMVLWELSLNESTYDQEYAQNAVAIGHAELPQGPCYIAGWMFDTIYDVYLRNSDHYPSAREYTGPAPITVVEHAHWGYGGPESTSDVRRSDGEAALLTQAWNHQHSLHLNRIALSDLCGDNVWLFNDLVGWESGVSDWYRLPKFSYYLWQSQRDPNLVLADSNSGPMVFIANYWTANSPTDVKIYSNCDQVRLFINDNNQGTQNPDANSDDNPTNGLLQPPFTFATSYSAGELKAEGLIGGVVKATHIVNTPGSASALDVSIDTMGYDVTANGEDMVFVHVSVLDNAGTLVPTVSNEVTLTVAGPAVIVSPAVRDAEAGIASFLIRTLPEVGTITATATASGLSSDSSSITTVAHADKVVCIEQVYIPAGVPGKASNPSPGNTDTDVSLEAILSWTAGSGATSHDVYFGTDSTPDETEFRENQVELTHDPNRLDVDTTYYWRIDAKNDEGTTTGDVWSFTTGDGVYSDEANGETTVDGTVTSGDYTDTHASEDTYEAITEEVDTTGAPSSRTSRLEHKWTIDVSGGSTVTFYVEAYHSSNSDNDDFIFAYSTDDDTYYNMLTVIKTSDDDGTQDYSLPGDLSGTVHIRVMDTDRTGGNTSADTIYVDHMYIVSVE